MTDFLGRLEDGLSTQLGGHEPQPPGLSATAYSALPAPPQAASLGKPELEALDVSANGAVLESTDHFQSNPVDYDGVLGRDLQDAWFGRILIFPAELDFGPVLSTQIRELEILNNFRRASHSWDAFTNNVGSNVSIVSLPSLPTTLAPLAALVIEVEVLNQGPPTIQGTLDFDFDIISYSISVSGLRVILFSYAPDSPLEEVLVFETRILTHSDGTEQRIQLREAPRQIFQMNIFVDEINERDRLNALLFDWQGRVFGVPQWHEMRTLDAAATAGATVLNVDTTYASFRAGGLVVLWRDYKTFETLEVQSLTASTLTLSSSLVSSWPASTQVMPVHTAHVEPRVAHRRFTTGPGRYRLQFNILETAYVGSAAGFGSYNSKPLIDRPNRVQVEVEEGSLREVQVFDSLAAPPIQASGWLKSKPLLSLGLLGTTSQETWEIRQLFHYLAGRRTSFYLGTGRAEIVPQGDIGNLATTIDFDYIDYGLFYNTQSPRNHIRVVRKDGTTSQHEITGTSIVVDQVTERINITPAISPALPLVDLDRIEFLTLSRLESDGVRFRHVRPGVAQVQANTIGIPA